MAALALRGSIEKPRIRDGDHDCIPLPSNANADKTVTLTTGDPVLNGVFNQRLNGQDGDLGGKHRIVNVEFSMELRAKTQLLNLQVGTDDFDFLGKRAQARIDRKGVSKQTCQIEDKSSCGGVLTGDHSIESIQSIKEEVRINLRLQGAQLCLQHKRLHFRAANPLDLLGNNRREPFEHLQVFTQISPSSAPRTQQQNARVAAGKSQRSHGLHPVLHISSGRV